MQESPFLLLLLSIYLFSHMKDFKSWPRHFLFVKESLTFRLSEYELLDFIIVMITSFLKILLLPLSLSSLLFTLDGNCDSYSGQMTLAEGNHTSVVFLTRSLSWKEKCLGILPRVSNISFDPWSKMKISKLILSSSYLFIILSWWLSFIFQTENWSHQIWIALSFLAWEFS